jgi:HAD superfamily phosphatase
MNRPVLVFDMDGVLVDVSESYRETIARTVAHFTGGGVSRRRIQDYKNQGGFNDDWELTHRIIVDAGVNVAFEEVKEYFQRVFLGSPSPGGNGEAAAASDALILRERWIAQPGKLEALAGRFRLAIFTGRPRAEAGLSLRRFAGDLAFDPIVAMEDVGNKKPHPEGLLRIVGSGPACPAFYIGDTVDDARCARAAGVPFIGVTAPSSPGYLDLVFLFQAEKPYAIVDDINYLDEVFAA